MIVSLPLDCKIMKNRKFIGHLPEQAVRKKSKPFIVEVDKNRLDSQSAEAL